ncbi:hypothetical protein JTE90_007774 [Oedothorax gibbosus]|uniref:Uncharacterized protein n=1 Tax=Oedothorax gibbosus TaxID=931172 RepID=A0AAV6TCQ8_9ARAC|nr:hypothetical protein JTE90_007774 [Oedothorax gibbosus]
MQYDIGLIGNVFRDSTGKRLGPSVAPGTHGSRRRPWCPGMVPPVSDPGGEGCGEKGERHPPLRPQPLQNTRRPFWGSITGPTSPGPARVVEPGGQRLASSFHATQKKPAKREKGKKGFSTF